MVFQSTLAPEGASDTASRISERGGETFQSTLAPEGASDSCNVIRRASL